MGGEKARGRLIKVEELSIHHLSPADADWLLARARLEAFGDNKNTPDEILGIAATYKRFYIECTQRLSTGDDIPLGVRSLVQHARANGFEQLLLDDGAEVIDELLHYDWDRKPGASFAIGGSQMILHAPKSSVLGAEPLMRARGDELDVLGEVCVELGRNPFMGSMSKLSRPLSQGLETSGQIDRLEAFGGLRYGWELIGGRVEIQACSRAVLAGGRLYVDDRLAMSWDGGKWSCDGRPVREWCVEAVSLARPA